jgi:hypothetical protein
MRLLFYTLIILFVNFNSAYSQDATNYYGEEFSTLDIKNYSINKQDYLNNTEDLIKIEAEILSTCPKKGCWMKIKAEEDTILVRFKDYGFFIPKDGVVGNKTVINGKISVDTLSVAQLRHYAEDAGKSKEEINKIINPEISITFLANGVMIRED